MNHNLTQEKFHDYWASHLCSTFLPHITEQEVWDKYTTRSLTFVRMVWFYLYGDSPEDMDIRSRECDEQLLQYMHELQTVEPEPGYTQDQTLWYCQYICTILNSHGGARKYTALGYTKRWFVDNIYLMNQEDQYNFIDKLIEDINSKTISL